MLGTLVRKEILGHLLSLRFQLMLGLVLVLMTGGALLFRGEYDRQLSDWNGVEARRVEGLSRAAGQPLPLYFVLSYEDQLLTTRPSPLGFIADAHGRDLPNAVKVNWSRITTPERMQRGNPMLLPFEALDWILVVSVVLSFAALVLTFDAIAGDREQGTLRLVLANAVPRGTIVLAKALGAWLVLVAAFGVGALLQLAILGAAGVVPLDGTTLVRVALAFTIATTFIAVFVVLGLLVSSRTAAPASALVVGLLVWALVAIVVPRTPVLLAQALHRVESGEEVQKRAEAAQERAYAEFTRLHPGETNKWLSGYWSPGESLELSSLYWKAQQGPYAAWRAEQFDQVRRARALASVSPATLLAGQLERLAGTGLGRYVAFLEAAERYREGLENIVRSRYPFDAVEAPGQTGDVMKKLAAVKVDPSDLPAVGSGEPPLGAALAAATTGGTVFAVLALLLYLATAFSFARYDVR